MITVKQEKGKSLIEVLNEKMATIGGYLGNQELTEVSDYDDESMEYPATEVRYYTLHTDGLTFDQGLCDYYFTTNCGEYRFGLTPVILI